MSELATALIADSYAAPPSHILESLPDELAQRSEPGIPHSIYAEVWHMAFWQQVTLDWIAGVETPFPRTPEAGFPTEAQRAEEPWLKLHARFFSSLAQAAAAADQGPEQLDQLIRCPSRPGQPERTMSVRDQLISLAAHNAYHLGRIVLLRQMFKAWPPASGGFSW